MIGRVDERWWRPARVLGTAAFNSWIGPALIALVVIAVIWVGWRWMREEHLGTLAAVPLFAGLSKRDLLSVLGSAKVVEFPSGSTLVTEGQQGTGFYVITKGRTRVTVDGSEVAKLDEGSYFGEIAVLDGGPRAASVTAETLVTTLELTRTALLHTLDKEPKAARSVYEGLRRAFEQAGGTAPEIEDAQITSAQITDIAKRLREIEHPGWGSPTSTRRRRLEFSKWFAHGG